MSGITWLGHGSWQLDTPAGARLLIDPWQNGNPSWPAGYEVARADAILLTHGHGDHAGDAKGLAERLSCPVVAHHELASWLEGQGVANVVGFNKGGCSTVAGVAVTMTNAVHSSTAPDGTPLGDPAGFVLEQEGMPTLYFTGDTAVHADMGLIGEIYRPQIAVLSIGDHYTMGPKEAAVAVELLGVKRIVPCHWGTFGLLTGTPDELEKLAPSGFTIEKLQPGESVTV